MANKVPKGPPYPPNIWSLGGRPEKNVDIPVTAVFLVLFAGGAAMNMIFFQLNKRQGHKFLFSLLMFGFCMARIVTSILRIASVSLPTDIPLAIAAQVFTTAGVVLIFVVNLFFAQRLVRAAHPSWGWHVGTGTFFNSLLALIIITIVMVITSVVQQLYTLSNNTHRIDRDIQLYGVTYLAIVSFIPIPIVIALALLPRKDGRRIDKFGAGSWHGKLIVLLIGSVLVCFGAAYRAGVLWLTPVPRTQPVPGVMTHAPFYIVNFTIEILTVYLYGFARIDRRFHVPDGASKHKSYARAAEFQAPNNAMHEDEEQQNPSRERSYTARSGDTGDTEKSWSALGHPKSAGEKEEDRRTMH